jgi:hypothetical protein
MDRFHDSFRVAHHIIVPEPYHAVTFRIQPARSSFVAATVIFVSMLRTIDLNDEARFQAREVRNIRSDRDLSSEVTSLYLKPSKVTPKNILCSGGVRSQRLGAFALEITD